MKITYIHHSSFCVETGGAVLVFDYYDGSGVPFCRYFGKMPEYPQDMPMYIFSSHSHRDHFAKEVLRWSRRYANIRYIFAKEIKKKLGNQVIAQMGLPVDVREKITYMKPGELRDIGEARVETLISTDSGVAFLVEIGGRTIFHAGDLNWWKWEGESEEFLRFQETTFKREVSLLENREIDLSFVVVDPRLAENKFLGINYFMRTVRSGYVCPMHLWKHYELIEEYKKRLAPEDRNRILSVSRENQETSLPFHR